MVAIHYQRRNELGEGAMFGHRYRTGRTQITIGRSQGNDLVLADMRVSRRHCRFSQGDGGWTVEDLGSMHGTSINGLRVRVPTPVTAGQVIEVASFVLVLDASAGKIESVEESLLEAIASNDPGSRLVYADWLEERGDGTRAEFLRLLQAEIDHDRAGRIDRVARLRELVGAIDVEWRLRVSHVIAS